MVKLLDPRLTPARPDIAAASLRGLVNAAHYVDGQVRQVHAATVSLYGTPDATSPQLTELLMGEFFEVYETEGNWAWGQATRDHYVGYVRTDALGPRANLPDHYVTALRTPIFAAPALKSAVLGYAHGNAVFAAGEKQGAFVKAEPMGWVFADHTAPMGEKLDDWVSFAERLLGVPYVWGGRSSFGMDCSGLVQDALQAGGIAAPRDSDLQECEMGQAIEMQPDLVGLQRGDLVFWKGHVAIMVDGQSMVHASGYHLAVICEPLKTAAARIKKTAGAISAIRRL